MIILKQIVIILIVFNISLIIFIERNFDRVVKALTVHFLYAVALPLPWVDFWKP
jgi:hypothetical protein